MHVLIFRGESTTLQADNLCASAWLDRKIVMLLYTGFDPTSTGQVLRRQKDGTQVSFTCPDACVEYNKYMGGVDLGDQHRSYYHVRMKCRKFYRYIASFLFDVAITNSFILYCMAHTNQKLKSLKFREILATELIGNYCSRKRPGRGGHVVKPLALLHFPIRILCENGPKRGRCALCQQKKRRSDSPWYCRECDVWLCHQGLEDDCFLGWHKNIL